MTYTHTHHRFNYIMLISSDNHVLVLSFFCCLYDCLKMINQIFHTFSLIRYHCKTPPIVRHHTESIKLFWINLLPWKDVSFSIIYSLCAIYSQWCSNASSTFSFLAGWMAAQGCSLYQRESLTSRNPENEIPSTVLFVGTGQTVRSLKISFGCFWSA